MTPDPPRVVGRYEIVRQLGRGGMATVHLARQRALDREVALKELHPAARRRRRVRQALPAGVPVAGALNHPSVVSVIEYFEHDGAPFIAMEYLERGSLRPLVGRLTLAHVAGVLEGVLGGLAEAAAQGIVHRDLKPENVLLTVDGHAKVADFGIAKALGQLQMTELRTATGAIVGTPAYMAPEQVMGTARHARDRPLRHRLIAYELLAGRHPYEGVDAPMALMLRHANDEPPPLGLVREDLPPGVVAWVHAMLAKDPAARPASAADAWDWLEGEVADELGPRWRRAAALPEPDATVGLRVGRDARCPTCLRGDAPSPAAPARCVPAAPHAGYAGHALGNGDLRRAGPRLRRRGCPRRRDLLPPTSPPPRALPLAVMAATLVLAGAAGSHLLSGEEPPPAAAAPAPKGPSLAERVRHDLGPALRANRQVTAELTELVPGSDPGTHWTGRRRPHRRPGPRWRTPTFPPPRSALRAQVSYLAPCATRCASTPTARSSAASAGCRAGSSRGSSASIRSSRGRPRRSGARGS